MQIPRERDEDQTIRTLSSLWPWRPAVLIRGMQRRPTLEDSKAVMQEDTASHRLSGTTHAGGAMDNGALKLNEYER